MFVDIGFDDLAILAFYWDVSHVAERSFNEPAGLIACNGAGYQNDGLLGWPKRPSFGDKKQTNGMRFPTHNRFHFQFVTQGTKVAFTQTII